ncbi:MAG: maltose/maltodextrin ABC transporter ATP-binding protein MalK [Polymorphum sp.]|uniref:Glycerol-3-phosphate transporter ATP-binding subunit n=1 Tax=Pannonibacter phragmitetus TaxID=121719 RepID=A0A0U3PG39_9HYPH|nr:sn-glycerol-3-phosphate import ATP-binding protein UgpC [Pannonibacter phragmitetus]ALV26588.1 glycerol-3-phosphate transporter ATP-binding subunit [Pannonibacter phragmitetus]MBA4204891.1 maltose/maltodextrin ABC transporter ATP-binding protein MalK [Polymorphum sp.]
MATITLDNVRKVYAGGVEAVKGVSMDIADGEFIVLVGPSGCGKSTLLRMIAGLEEISSGDIRIGDRVVNRVDPSERDIAMVFQNYALYPHMTVYNNLAYGLRNRGVPKDEIDRRVKEAARILEIGAYLDRKPKALSGGQRQRVAMGRAIVREPAAFLFDEPLSNLDAKLRVQMRVEIKRLQKSLATTSVYVTHDQLEAMTLADRLVVLNGGQIEQIGDPISVYERPASTFVASFIGSPAMNLITTASANGRLSLPGGAGLDAPDMGKGAEVILGVRPEHLALASEQPAEAGGLTLDVVAGVLEPVGAESFLYGTVGSETGPQVVIRVPAHARYELGQRVSFTASAAKLHAFDKATGKRIED